MHVGCPLASRRGEAVVGSLVVGGLGGMNGLDFEQSLNIERKSCLFGKLACLRTKPASLETKLADLEVEPAQV